MSELYKTSYKVYTAWNYEKEIEDLNKASEEGWQLVKGGCFHSKFTKNDQIIYRYQLDYPGTIDDMPRYIETFREQGWEYINSTFNGWQYFRKVYDPSLPEEEYEIFTDHSSLKQMNNHWIKIATALDIIMILFTIIMLVTCFAQPSLPHILRTISYFCLIILLTKGILVMKHTDHADRLKDDSRLFGALLLIFSSLNLISLLL